MRVLHAFCRHSYITLIHFFFTFITGVCSEDPRSIVSRFAETSYLNSIEIQLTGCCMTQDLGVGNLGTDY